MRALVLDLGNSTLYCGVFANGRLTSRFHLPATAAVRGFGSVVARRIRGKIDAASLCSVAPALTPALVRGVRRAFGLEAVVLGPVSAHGLKIGYRRPERLGADRVSAALGARRLFPGRNVIIVDCGTATTVTALRRDGALLGGAILPGLGLWGKMLSQATARLPVVSVCRPKSSVGRTPREAIAAGNWIGHVGAIREIVRRVRKEAFGRAKAVVVGTGGHAPALASEKIFDSVDPCLVLNGLYSYLLQQGQGLAPGAVCGSLF